MIDPSLADCVCLCLCSEECVSVQCVTHQRSLQQRFSAVAGMNPRSSLCNSHSCTGDQENLEWDVPAFLSPVLDYHITITSHQVDDHAAGCCLAAICSLMSKS